VTALLASGFHVAPVEASLGGYAAAVPMSFLGHRGISFRSRGGLRGDATRFVVGQAINITLTIVTMNLATKTLHLSYLWGTLATMVLIPIANFLLMHFWVFSREDAEPAGAR
jgi:putative flippase GtrA